MSISDYTFSSVQMNNQFIMNKKLSKYHRNNSLTKPPLLMDASKEPNSMSHLLGLAVGMETNFEQMENRISSEEPKLSKEDPQETRHLKELLLLHLDWIQQQQESLLAKDKLILRLKQEKEALKCRLERMDRRMSLLRHKTDTSPPAPAETAMTPRIKDAGTASRGATLGSGRADTGGRGSKRKLSLEPQSLGKRFNSCGSGTGKVPRHNSNMVNRGTSMEEININQSLTEQTGTPTRGRTPRLSRTQRLRDTPNKHQAYLYSQQPPRKCRSQILVSADESLDTKTEPEDEEEEENILECQKSDRGQNSESDDDEVQFVDQTARKRTMAHLGHRTLPARDTVMRTDSLYYVHTQVQLAPWEISPKKETADNVLVPTWRIKQIPTGYQLEGTENLTDEIYSKRHQKPEADEKRRKRWDAQMLREQKMLERLQHRGGATSGACSSIITGTPKNKPQDDMMKSLLPNPDNIKFLEICDKVPVMAFGYPLPNIEQREFSLDWFDVERQAKEDHHNSNQRTSRGRRKHTSE